MYTNAGVLQVISVKDAAVNLVKTRNLLEAIGNGEVKVSKADFAALVRLEEDIKAHFVNRAELLGMTNVDNKSMERF